MSPILPALAEQYGGNAFTVGMLFSSYSFAQFLSAPIMGAIRDRYVRRAVMLLSLCGAILGFVAVMIMLMARPKLRRLNRKHRVMNDELTH